MNKLFIGLLIVAAGTGVFFLLRKKEKDPVAFDKELIVGKWKIDQLQSGKDSSTNFMTGIMGMVDSNTLKYQYEFTRTGSILRLLNDSVTKDSSVYAWKNSDLVWKESGDSTGSVLNIVLLTKDSLRINTNDSTVILFTRVK